MQPDDVYDPRHSGGDPVFDRPRTPVPGPAEDARVLRTGPTLDAAAAATLRRETRALLARSTAPLVVDLTAVRDVEPASASGVLRDLAYEAGEADVDLRVVRDPRAPAATRALLDDEALFELYPTLDAALGRGARTHR